MATAKPTTETLRELWELLRSYALQETVGPLRALGRSVGWGLAGAVLVSGGVLFLSLAALRAMQSETTLFMGRFMSVVPYAVVAVALVLILLAVALAVMRSGVDRLGEVES